MATIGLTDVLDDPAEAARTVAALACVDSASVVAHSDRRVVLRTILIPHDPSGVFVSQGYPIEAVHIVIHGDGRIHAVPKAGRGRPWKHRNSFAGVYMELCLWDPRDSEAIRWSWADGLEEYVRIVARHLIYEEYWRRTGQWPVEDSPHGEPSDGAWPIRTARMREAVERWRRG